MKRQLLDLPSLQLRLNESTMVVLPVGGRTRGTNELEVPGSCAQRSALIADLREQLDDDEVIVPLPLSLNEIQAWISYVEGQGRADSGPFSWRHCIELEDADRDAPDHDATLVRALKVGY